ncbi:hypothetical protein Tco_0833650, partial [Tanacetum coccineum]
QAAIAAGTSGEAAPPNPQTDHETVTEPVHQPASSHAHRSTSPRPPPTTSAAQLNKPENASIPDPNVADDPLGGSFVASPSRSTAAPPEGTTSGGAVDPPNLTALYTLVSAQGKKIESLESGLQAHKLLFKDVMGKLVKRVKFLKSKLKARGRNVILSESDNEEDEEQDVDSLIQLAKAAAFAADTSSIPADATPATEVPPSSSIHTDAASAFSADPSNKGKSPLVEEDPSIKERSFRQMEEDRLGAEAARKLYEEEQAELARVQEELKRKRQEDVINSAKYYNDDDWSDIMGQVHANKGLTADLLGPDVNEDNFAARMAAIIAERRRKFAAQRFQDKINKPMTFAQQKQFMRTFVKNQSSAIYSTGWTLKRSLKRPGADVEQPGSKKSKSSAAPQTTVPAATSAGVTSDVHQSPFVDTPPHSPKASSHPDVPSVATSDDPTVAPTPPCATPVSRSSGPRTRSQSFDADIKTYSTRRKSLAPRKMPSSEVDLNAPDTSFITVLSDDVFDASDDDTDPLFWHIFAAWEVIPTGLGDVNALYFTDKTSKYFTHLREILHLIDRQDLSKLYGMVVKHYEVNPLAGNGLILWGDLHVLFESTSGGSSVDVLLDRFLGFLRFDGIPCFDLATEHKILLAQYMVPNGLRNLVFKSLRVELLSFGFNSQMLLLEERGAVQQGPVRARVLNDLSAEEKERESQLYDEFEHFRQIKGENIQGYYVRFTKLINDMRNIKMTMSRMQLNSKFVNNMLPEWSRFITEVKLNRGLKESNCDQLYAYLKQHEVHANENKIMMERMGKLWFKMSVEDTMQIIKEGTIFREQYNEEWLVARNAKADFKEKMLLMQAQESGAVLDEEQSLFLAKNKFTNVDDDVDDFNRGGMDLALNRGHI